MYKLIQQYSHITVQKHLHIEATFRHVSVPTTTTTTIIVKEDNSVTKTCRNGA
jgi:hypothetical protein